MGNSIGGRIKELRLLQGMTQEKLAELCDTSVSSIARWESGSLHPNMKHQERLAKIFGMRIDDFYINLDTPVTQDYILSQVLKETQKLDLEEQKYVLPLNSGQSSTICTLPVFIKNALTRFCRGETVCIRF